MRHETIYRKECRFRVAPVRMWLIPHPMTSLAGLVRWSNQSSASTSKKSRERPTTASPHFNSSSAESALPPAATRTFFLRSEEHTSELHSLMRTSYAVFCLKTKKKQQ